MSLAETVLTLAKTNQAKIVGLAAIAVFLGYSLTFRKSSGKVIKSSLTNAAATLVYIFVFSLTDNDIERWPLKSEQHSQATAMSNFLSLLALPTSFVV